ncbi:60S acidic ribosomal protein P2-like [Microtus ochrogaster]|uniref:60S acidic ribosomal protein P2-like n=1 Tax=Microtus ochrogaster TaxID=79684 RepID=A0ABM0KL64_MICOH|nr:60S acidic ribosomal protein P2-like [Microtus ochrogaster]
MRTKDRPGADPAQRQAPGGRCVPNGGAARPWAAALPRGPHLAGAVIVLSAERELPRERRLRGATPEPVSCSIKQDENNDAYLEVAGRSSHTVVKLAPAAGSAPAAAEEKKDEKKEESRESDDDMGFGLFD